ncbi:MAG: hypothetical protein K2O30_07170 [Duncaniella sp.]|nr:hypothetical protein [Duncaniella sp.]
MAKFLRYMGEFLSRAGVVWRVEILQDAEAAFNPVGTLDFEADEALVIEWSHAEKEEVICGSTAILRIESPGDRTYEDLYTIAPGRIRMDVYRNNLLYWSGTLDPEFYEEPYEKAANYPVTLTFSDFGVLDRLKYDLSGMRSLSEIVDYCMNRTAINSIIDESLISTSLTAGGVKMNLADLKVRSDNFYDEDGEALTLKEVLEGILQPLALRMVQRAGRVYIYDLNALYYAIKKPVIWDGASQTMGTDKVYNNAKVTWSPYVQSSDLVNQECWTVEVNPEIDALNHLDGRGVTGLAPQPDDPAIVYSYRYGSNPAAYDIRNDWSSLGFSLWVSKQGKGAQLLNDAVRYFKVVPQNEGSECEGIAITWVSTYVEPSTGFWYDFTHQHNGFYDKLAGSMGVMGEPLFSTNPVWIPCVLGRSLDLHITMELLLDPRINYNNEAVDFHDGRFAVVEQKVYYNKWKNEGNFLYVPVRILFTCDDGRVYCWDNRASVASADTFHISSLPFTKGEWVEDTGDVWGYLCYYNPDDRKEDCGVLGWKKNRPAINVHTDTLTLALKLAEGQYITYPGGKSTTGGYITVEVLSGWVAKNNHDKEQPSLFAGNYVEWAMCKMPSIEIVNGGLYENELSTDDIEYNAEINPDAKEGISIDTICGSSKDGVPTARGAYFLAQTGAQITELARAGRTSQIEDLLIGTLFSQFGGRRTKLSGEMVIADTGLCAYTEVNQGDKVFMITSDSQDVIADVSDATITELRPDEYKQEIRVNVIL